ncbi:disintegrin and metalloproteinase domain-containing protein 8a [Chanos chanos]|uniref:Disintegrin and metalloproteinase domain-containing protein 8a n=1 Tax=Chanos chanos TaxID=29144 RepID=A0A6J2VAV1_CHACN|nr:disintegrin and metalloproteinase domain-containing protein 8 [Chanos chanos]
MPTVTLASGTHIPAMFYAGGIPTLPHVMRHDVVRLQKLNDRLKRSTTSPKAHPEKLEYALFVEEKNLTLCLERNRGLLGRQYTLTYDIDSETQVTESPDYQDHCYYHGHIRDMKDSGISVSLCSGMRGILRAEKKVYLIEPLEGSLDGDHAIYQPEHLRRKRTVSGYGNDIVYDFNPKLAALLKPSTKYQIAPGAQRVVEMVMVVDKKEHQRLGSVRNVETRMLEIANHVDKLYRPLNFRVMLVGLEVWSQGDRVLVNSQPNITLDRFLDWRQNNLLKRKKHDNAQFVTDVDFEGSTVGLASMNSMCSARSGAVNQDHNRNPVVVAVTIAHEMGHNLGMSHDSEDCVCPTAQRSCVMGESISFVHPEAFSSCSQKALKNFLEEYNAVCLLDVPSTDELYGGPVCGNAFVEKGEECDCGTVEECTNPCCNATSCRLTEGSQCAHGECCHECQLKQTGSLCRKNAHDCDLAEFCTGGSAHCPPDSYKMNGLPCKSNQGYCYNGQCPTHKEHCRTLWGPDAEVADEACFDQINCVTRHYAKCAPQKCGKIFCSGGTEFPITREKIVRTITPGGKTCNVAVDSSGTGDLGMVPTGTKCGTNQVCYNSICQDLQIYGTQNCSAKCHSHGVCNHKRQCHCDPGWAPPHCSVRLSDSPSGQNAVIVGVTVAMSILILLVLVIGGTVYCRKRRGTLPAKSFQEVHSTSGQSNPAFQSGSTVGSPRCRPVSISKPTLVESSATQACHSLIVVAAPSRPAPPTVKPSMSPLATGGRVHHLNQTKSLIQPSKLLPPSRPLPPLTSKPGHKPPVPPLPPAKPRGLQSAWPPVRLPQSSVRTEACTETPYTVQIIEPGPPESPRAQITESLNHREPESLKARITESPNH